VGASLGALAGAVVAEKLIEPFGVLQLMLVGAVVVAFQLLLTNYIDRLDRGRRPPRVRKVTAAPPVNAFAMVFRTRYLLLIGLMLMIANWVNTTGEYVLSGIVTDTASAMIASGQAPGLSQGQIIGDFYAKYFALVNATGLVLQLFVVSRIVKRFGVGWAVMVLPALAFGAYNILVFMPTLTAVLTAKVVENSTDYSLNNTVRNMLFLPCSYEQKFSAKQAIDSFFVRMGDVLSAALVFVGTTFLMLPARGFVLVNVVLVVVWVVLAWHVGRHYKTLTTSRAAASAAA